MTQMRASFIYVDCIISEQLIQTILFLVSFQIFDINNFFIVMSQL